MTLSRLRTPPEDDGSTRRPAGYSVDAAAHDDISRALDAGLGDAQERNAPPENPFIPLDERQRVQIGPVLPSGWLGTVFEPVKGWHALVESKALTAAGDALRAAAAKVEEAETSMASLRNERNAEKDSAVRAARAAARAGEPIPEPKATDWDTIEAYRAEVARSAYRKALTVAGQYAATAKQIDRSQIIDRAEKASAAKAKTLAHAEKVAAEVAHAVEVDRLLGDAAADLKIGPRWYRGGNDEVRELPGKATAGSAAAVRWLASKGHDVHANMVDSSTVLPRETREFLATHSETTHDALARLESTEDYKVSSLTGAHRDRYANATLTAAESEALRRRELPPTWR